MINALRIRNLRSFSDSNHNSFIKLSPLTVLIGKNSSGKSSFLRTLPLLRQSVEAKTIGPILWYGSYVDFGAFSEVKNHDTDTDSIYFDLKVQLDMMKLNRRRYVFRGGSEIRSSLDIDIEIGVSEEKSKTTASSIRLKIDGNTFYLSLSSDNKCTLKINDEDEFSGLSYRMDDRFLPSIGKIRDTKSSLFDGEVVTYKTFDSDFIRDSYYKNNFHEIESLFHTNTSRSTITDGLRRLGIYSKESLPPLLRYVYRNNKSFIRKFKNNENKIVDLFYNFQIQASLNEILRTLSTELERTFKSIRYIAPLRATAERYYRHQDLQVDEIDHTGSNLAMLLKALPISDKKEFSNWTTENFGFGIRVDEHGLHYALKIKNLGDNREYNINDMGFGFSQILPIIASIWFEVKNITTSKYRDKQLIFTIEQPELHLHPEYQSKLATLFAKVIKTAKELDVKISIVFETHSKTMIDTIGDCIEDEIIENTDVNVVIFNKGQDQKYSNVEISNFDKDGMLNNWPIGFFSGR
ncbi:AAA family ATPase [Vibrio crassostreae]|uniref:AAA family ATPase n=1 Tax=Vibrio crassostreae TaxID=246167 RepID=UPI00104F5788|nr:AAA family ATPase [Vibrio crassostreae]TCN89978.1 AAA ATPase-like protein [Vibrio crassostreae]TCW18970.1 AAA ATPase-like protein [Vibrio crassostreae]